MTSSLVGSEMCIRDSCTMCVKHPRVRENNMQWRSVHCKVRIPRYNSSWTVSYTHLTLPTICSV
eukprot:12841120-Prorocentrum_lima.AAC.1